MKYICEICNKQYNSASAAEQCELVHKKEAEDASMRASAAAKINEALNAYIARYKALPELNLTLENIEVVFDTLIDKVCDHFDSLMGLLNDDDDECIACDTCTGCCDCDNAK